MPSVHRNGCHGLRSAFYCSVIGPWIPRKWSMDSSSAAFRRGAGSAKFQETGEPSIGAYHT